MTPPLSERECAIGLSNVDQYLAILREQRERNTRRRAS